MQDTFLGSEFVLQYRTYDFVVNGALSIALGVTLALVYRHTHKGISFSQSFTQTLVFVALIVAIVMMTIGNNLARAFALVGALSIIRFRTVVKDTRDTAFVFGSLAIGMAAGTGLHVLACVATALIAIVAEVCFWTNFGALYKSEFVLRFRFERTFDSGAYLARLQSAARQSSLLHVEPSADGSALRLTYDISLSKDVSPEQFSAELARTPGVSDVALIVSKNDVDY